MSLSIQALPAATLDAPSLARLITEGYTGYPVPLHLDEALLAWMVSRWDESLADSIVLRDGAVPVAVALLARRGHAGWIGGLGVVPEYRRRGLGRLAMRAVLERAAAAGLRDVTLEVLDTNRAAHALYLGLGFADTRRLEIWRLAAADGPPPSSGPQVDEVADDAAFAAAPPLESPPWQRADATLARMRALGDPLRGFMVTHEGRRGAVVLRVAQGPASLVQARGPREPAWWGAALAPLARAAGAEALRVLNAPSDGVLARAFAAAGATLDAAQVEMRWRAGD